MENLGQIALQIIILAVMLLGLFSLLTMVVPGLTIIWAAALIYGLVTGFTWGSGIIFAFITLFMIGGNVVDNIMMGAGARQQGASWMAIIVALLAGVIAGIFWTPFGGLAVALAAIFIVEWIRQKDWRKAWDSTREMAMGCGWAGVIRFTIGMVMIGLWWLWAFVINR
ncbi:MAG TPA: DUF456 domain-containing protein [Anaerolineaceae bacterium]|jgi:uncharacterized protein YqgC (DUF456 family)|nr:DUF456 domain-containing protein [Longilinea sp.]HNR47091.1 DUF456 domain-containing protein [Anaerolineaceae bacterium]HNS38470.1 DUF456 domain-containing protein [Anaerolineaceae bacterium]HOG79652.1 DUF456 domain-containing protein [Anaerolineaceae bacterium]HQN44135.1 DUF456 domain-containing protein [Anaerolineaceae bacterium]